MLMQNFGVTNNEHYGMLWNFWSGQWVQNIYSPFLHYHLHISFLPFGVGEGGVCVTQQGTVFTILTLEKGVKITLHLWKRGKCHFSMTLEQTLFSFFS